jgi:hypothetical protein
MTNNYGGHCAGAIECGWGSVALVKDCTITLNSGGYGDLFSMDAGAVYCEGCTLTVHNCAISQNTSGRAGAIRSFEGNLKINNCTFTGNSGTDGQTIVCDSYEQKYPSSVKISNCILWDPGDQIWNNDDSAITIAHSDARNGWPGPGNIDADPCFADPNNGDYHLKSQAGRWDPNSQTWVIDDVTSPCIDAGDPLDPVGLEPFPNGGIINMGAYAGTPEASRSYFGQPPCEIIVAGDINGDCQIDFKDFFFVGLHWLEER